ncbi:MAG: flagellar biosynthetic protein FliR [Planctomycetes bacterium]|nr:flagellar biosynthetic protein FliR [Planctomycetota bacterium]
MPWSLLQLPLALPVLALVLFRLGGLMLTAPIFASTLVPRRMRAALVLTLGAMMVPVLHRQAPTDLTWSAVVLGGVGEMMVGAIIGLAIATLLSGAEVAGVMVGQQAGIALSEVFDPTFAEQSTVVTQIYAIVLMLVFLVLGGHRAAVAAVLDTYEVIPMLSFRLEEPMVVLLLELLTAAFGLGVRLAGPVLITLFLTELAFAFLSRTLPQLNVLSVGFTVRVMLAVATAGITLALAGDVMAESLREGLATIRAAFGLDPARLRLTY